MTASRYAVSGKISLDVVRDAIDNPRVLEIIKDNMRHRLGNELVGVLEESKTPVTVRLTWYEKSFPLVYSDVFEIALVADLEPVETMHVIVPEMQLSYFKIGEGSPIPIEWQCGYCGQTNLIDNLDCRKCGAPRKPLR